MIERIELLPIDLGSVDALTADLLACAAYEDVRPLRGLAALLDWRLAGRLSHALATDFASGRSGESVLFHMRGPVRATQLLFVGMGSLDRAGTAGAEAALRQIAATAGKLSLRHVALEVPGRASDALSPEEAAQLLRSTWQLESPVRLTVFDEPTALGSWRAALTEL